MNLHENARPAAAALAQNQGHRCESRNRQKNQNMAVVAATSGSSMVASVPWAIRLGESAKSQAARAIARGPWLWRLHAAVSRDRHQPDPERTQPDHGQELPLVADRVINPFAMAHVIEQPEHGDLLQLPEGHRRTHPRDLGLVARSPPSSGRLQVGDLIVGRRILEDRIDRQRQTDDNGERGQPTPGPADSGSRLAAIFVRQLGSIPMTAIPQVVPRATAGRSR